jgi:hypothetical protein
MWLLIPVIPCISTYWLCTVILNRSSLILILLTWRIGWALSNASWWQMGFNLAFKGLTLMTVRPTFTFIKFVMYYWINFVQMVALSENLCCVWLVYHSLNWKMVAMSIRALYKACYGFWHLTFYRIFINE